MSSKARQLNIASSGGPRQPAVLRLPLPRACLPDSAQLSPHGSIRGVDHHSPQIPLPEQMLHRTNVIEQRPLALGYASRLIPSRSASRPRRSPETPQTKQRLRRPAEGPAYVLVLWVP